MSTIYRSQSGSSAARNAAAIPAASFKPRDGSSIPCCRGSGSLSILFMVIFIHPCLFFHHQRYSPVQHNKGFANLQSLLIFILQICGESGK
ncbi:hypothetical protein P8452_07200 [Trifolium repens]|nr:hypothetical protein P8452_07200 [Trifolium repens]